MNSKTLLVVLFAIAAVLIFTEGAHAYGSGFPAYDYPSNQYGMEARYYDGPWGERMVYGAYGYFPNFNGNRPYGYRSYGYFYTPQDLRYGNTMRFVSNNYGGYGSFGNRW